MPRFTFQFRVFQNATRTKQVLKVCAKYEGSKQYLPRVLSLFGKGDLSDPDFSKWDQKRQRFKGKDPSTNRNNAILEAIEAFLGRVMKDNTPDTIDEFWKLVEAAKKGSPILNGERTLGWHLQTIIEEMYSGKNNKLPSNNYQCFVRLLHHLEREDQRPRSRHIIRVPISKVGDKEFQQFGEYLRTLPNPNYHDVMTYFKRAHNMAIKKKLAKTKLTYHFNDDAPPKTFDQLAKMNRGVSSLTTQQIEMLENLDVTQIQMGNHPRMDFFKQLYLDTCLLMFYLYSRPIDILNMRYDHIKQCSQGAYIEYLPIKKKNAANAARQFVRCPISEKAWAIIKKYEGMNPGGYLLPYSENYKAWDLNDPKDYHTRYNRTNKILCKINSFLKKLGDYAHISFENDTLTTYVFRHSAISIAILEKMIPPIVVAKMAGTSLKEIERSYMDHTAKMFDYA